MERAEGGFDFGAGVDVVGDIIGEGRERDAARVCAGFGGGGFTVSMRKWLVRILVRDRGVGSSYLVALASVIVAVYTGQLRRLSRSQKMLELELELEAEH